MPSIQQEMYVPPTQQGLQLRRLQSGASSGEHVCQPIPVLLSGPLTFRPRPRHPICVATAAHAYCNP